MTSPEKDDARAEQATQLVSQLLETLDDAGAGDEIRWADVLTALVRLQCIVLVFAGLDRAGRLALLEAMQSDALDVLRMLPVEGEKLQ